MRSKDKPEDTTAALLRAGRTLFAERGYDGASVRAITKAAGVNLGAVTYHFGSKRAFYDAVLAAALAPLVEAVAAAGSGPGEPMDRLEAVVRALFDFVFANPDVVLLLLQEITSGRNPPQPVVAALQANLKIVTSVLREGQARRQIRSGDPRLMAFSLVSQPIYFTLARRPMKVLAGLDQRYPRIRERIVEHAVAFARRALSAGSAGR